MLMPSMLMTPRVRGTRPRIASATVDLPQPDSPTRPRHSPARRLRLTPLTARSRRAPPPRPSSRPPTWNSTARSSTSSSSAPSPMMMATDETALPQHGHGGLFHAADARHPLAARMKAAAGRKVRNRRPHAGYFLQSLPAERGARPKARQRADQP